MASEQGVIAMKTKDLSESLYDEADGFLNAVRAIERRACLAYVWAKNNPKGAPALLYSAQAVDLQIAETFLKVAGRLTEDGRNTMERAQIGNADYARYNGLKRGHQKGVRIYNEINAAVTEAQAGGIPKEIPDVMKPALAQNPNNPYTGVDYARAFLGATDKIETEIGGIIQTIRARQQKLSSGLFFGGNDPIEEGIRAQSNERIRLLERCANSISPERNVSFNR